MNDSIDTHRGIAGFEGLTSVAQDDGPQRLGSATGRVSRRKPMGFDRDAALITEKVYVTTVTMAAVMDDTEAAKTCASIMRAFSMHMEMPEVKQAFMDAVLMCLAFNGTSVLVPTERVTFGFYDGERHHEFEAIRVYQILGANARRFGRCYADDILLLSRALFAPENVADEGIQAMADMARALAYRRGVSMMPWLFADCLEFANGLATAERDMYTRSKQAVIGASANVVDRRVTTAKIESADGHVSGLGLADSPTNFRD